MLALHVQEIRVRLKYLARDVWKRDTERERQKWGQSEWERWWRVIRWCYLGTGRCVWHNLKLEIAVSISPHSTATRSTDNKSSLILLKISRECSGGWDEGDEREEGEEVERGGGGGRGWVTAGDKRPNEGEKVRRLTDWRNKLERQQWALKHLRREKVSPVFHHISLPHLPIISPNLSISVNQPLPSI